MDGGSSFQIVILDLLIISLLGSITAPLLALFLAAFAENKVAGFILERSMEGLATSKIEGKLGAFLALLFFVVH